MFKKLKRRKIPKENIKSLVASFPKWEGRWSKVEDKKVSEIISNMLKCSCYAEACYRNSLPLRNVVCYFPMHVFDAPPSQTESQYYEWQRNIDNWLKTDFCDFWKENIGLPRTVEESRELCALLWMHELIGYPLPKKYKHLELPKQFNKLDNIDMSEVNIEGLKEGIIELYEKHPMFGDCWNFRMNNKEGQNVYALLFNAMVEAVVPVNHAKFIKLQRTDIFIHKKDNSIGIRRGESGSYMII